MIRNEVRFRLERGERRAEGGVALLGGFVEAIVSGSLFGHLPNAFDRVEFRRIRRQPE